MAARRVVVCAGRVGLSRYVLVVECSYRAQATRHRQQAGCRASPSASEFDAGEVEQFERAGAGAGGDVVHRFGRGFEPRPARRAMGRPTTATASRPPLLPKLDQYGRTATAHPVAIDPSSSPPRLEIGPRIAAGTSVREQEASLSPDVRPPIALILEGRCIRTLRLPARPFLVCVRHLSDLVQSAVIPADHGFRGPHQIRIAII